MQHSVALDWFVTTAKCRPRRYYFDFGGEGEADTRLATISCAEGTVAEFALFAVPASARKHSKIFSDVHQVSLAGWQTQQKSVKRATDLVLVEVEMEAVRCMIHVVSNVGKWPAGVVGFD